jgi:predicted Zn-dependent peptidase
LKDTCRATRLENGLRIVTEEVADVASATVGIWVENGSCFETAKLNGISHFIEHLLFKGTHDRSAFQIVEEIERLGGSINAFTSKEHTCYHARALSAHCETVLDVLGDVVLNSAFRAEDIEVEREVIAQEILDVEDSPEDFVHDYFLQSYWPGHPLGWPVTGSVDTVADITREDIVGYVRSRYRPDRMLVAAAGALDHDVFVDACRERFLGMSGTFDPPAPDMPDFNPGLFVCQRDLEQVHIVLGLPGVSVTDERREVAEVLFSALGGGMMSRLFQRVREEKGLVYSIYSFQSPFENIGYSGVYAATVRDHVEECMELITVDLAAIAASGLEADELERTKAQLIGSIPLALESTESRMFRIARNQMEFGRQVTIDETTKSISSVSNEDVQALAEELFAFERLAVALLGDADDDLLTLPAS